MAGSNGKKLVIVESPAKAKTIAGYLGSDYLVESSIGHIRDLPNNASEIPAKLKGESWARLGVNVDKDFEPLYVVDSRKKKVVSDLKAKLKNADELLLATDEDREGEAIAWHLREVLDPKVPVRRMVFHEITRPAIERALGETREIDARLVDAQETRRILDRLYGYEVSPVLWRKIMQGLSAGRVQSVATRLVVERERERMKFVAAEYWDIVATYEPGAFTARLTSIDGRRVAQGRDFAQDGTLRQADAVQLTEAGARELAAGLEGAAFTVSSVEEKPYTRRPAAPFMTSTLQQEASRKLRLSSQQTMRVAQRLYENGYITYMRTDSTTLSESALAAARDQARELYGADSVPAQPRQYNRKVKNAQEAHEAIRPAGDRFRTPEQVRRELTAEEFNVYDLIWKRTVASQMEDARGQTVSVRIAAAAADGRSTEFSTAGTVITFRGFLLAYEEGLDEPSGDAEEKVLPPLTEGDALNAIALEPDGHSTSPPPRFTEASLVKALEERGIGTALDLRRDHGHDPRPRLRAQAGPGAHPRVSRLRGREAAREPLPSARRLRVHRAHGGRPRRDRLGRRGAHGVAPALLLRRGRRRRSQGARRRPARRDRRARDQHASSCPAATSSCGSASTARTSSAAPTGRRCRPTSRPTSSRPLAPRRSSPRETRSTSWARTRRADGRSLCARAATAPM